MGMLRNFFSGAISQKVLVATITGIATTILTWIATNNIWHVAVPANVKQLIPALGGVIGSFAGGYIAKHKVTPGELRAAIDLLHQFEDVIFPKATLLAEPIHVTQPSPSLATSPPFANHQLGNAAEDIEADSTAAIDTTSIPAELLK